MKKLLIASLFSIIVFSAGGCATMRALFGDIKTDPAITGMTGWWFQVGMNAIPIPGASAIPLPSITIGRGTIFRVGVTEEAHIKTGEAVKLGASSVGTSSLPDIISDGSLSIDTKDSSKAIEAMQGVYSPVDVTPKKVKDVGPIANGAAPPEAPNTGGK